MTICLHLIGHSSLPVSSFFCHRYIHTLVYICKINQKNTFPPKKNTYYRLWKTWQSTVLRNLHPHFCVFRIVWNRKSHHLFTFLRKIDRLLDVLELTEGDQVLEVGCGWGSLAIRSLGHLVPCGGFEKNGTRTGPFSGLGMGRNSTQ